MKGLFSSFMFSPVFLFGQLVGTKFPELTATTLADRAITFPTDLESKASIIIIAMERNTQKLVDTWTPFILENYGKNEEVSFYEVPMISGWYSWMSGFIDGGMRSGIDQSFHDNTATFYGDRSRYIKQLNMKDKSDCYIFILDETGTIRYNSSGNMTDEKQKQLSEIMDSVL